MNSYDDKTVRLSRSPLSTEQGSDADVATRPRAIVDEAPNALPVGTRLAEFEILGLIGEGGFGIVYLAYDTQLRRNVALKEYMPASLASRHGHSEVTVRSERHEEAFVAGLKSFVNEARMLAQFDHPALVKVHRFWEANSTAYMVMPYYEGTTLKDALRQMPAPPSEALLLNLLGPLVDALGALHRAQCFHRDISPDNIIILKDSGRPVLLDFGAARQIIGDLTQALTVILKTGYAPVEQYAQVVSLNQGPWTDVYALAATIYCAIRGTTPPASVGRIVNDTYVPLVEAAAGWYSERFLGAVDHALGIMPADRPQSIEAFADELGVTKSASATSSRMSFETETPAPVASSASARASVAARNDVGKAPTQQAPGRATRGASQTPASTAARMGKPMIAGLAALGLVVVAAGGAGWRYWHSTHPEQQTVSPIPAQRTIVETPAPARPPAASELPSQRASASPPQRASETPPQHTSEPPQQQASEPPPQPPATPAPKNTARVPPPATSLAEEKKTPPAQEKPGLEGRVTVVLDSSALVVAGRVVNLYGIRGEDGVQAEALRRYISARGGRLVCHTRTDDAYQCLLRGEDIAERAVRNGWARSRAGAPGAYVAAENEARSGRRGIWAM